MFIFYLCKPELTLTLFSHLFNTFWCLSWLVKVTLVFVCQVNDLSSQVTSIVFRENLILPF